MSDLPPCAETGDRGRYTPTKSDELVCRYCGKSMPADGGTYLSVARQTFRPAKFRYAGHYFYWRGQS